MFPNTVPLAHLPPGARATFPRVPGPLRECLRALWVLSLVPLSFPQFVPRLYIPLPYLIRGDRKVVDRHLRAHDLLGEDPLVDSRPSLGEDYHQDLFPHRIGMN